VHVSHDNVSSTLSKIYNPAARRGSESREQGERCEGLDLYLDRDDGDWSRSGIRGQVEVRARSG